MQDYVLQELLPTHVAIRPSVVVNNSAIQDRYDALSDENRFELFRVCVSATRSNIGIGITFKERIDENGHTTSIWGDTITSNVNGILQNILIDMGDTIHFPIMECNHPTVLRQLLLESNVNIMRLLFQHTKGFVYGTNNQIVYTTSPSSTMSEDVKIQMDDLITQQQIVDPFPPQTTTIKMPYRPVVEIEWNGSDYDTRSLMYSAAGEPQEIELHGPIAWNRSTYRIISDTQIGLYWQNLSQ